MGAPRFTAGGRGQAGGFDDIFGGMFGAQGAPGGRGSYQNADFGDIFGGMFGGGGRGSSGFGGFGPTKGRDVNATTTLDFTSAINGDTVRLQGVNGKAMNVRIPAGVDDGQKIRLKGKGEPSPDGGPPGDLTLTVTVSKHPVFTREGRNLRVDVPITFIEAVEGATIEVPTLGGDPVKLRVAPGTPSGRVLRVKGRGVTSGSQAGDLLATVHVVVPGRLTPDAAKAIKTLKKALPDENPRDDLLAKARQA
jgi:molecular chaperone DnaJ